MEVRPETLVNKAKSLSPTTWMEVMIETFDRADMAEKIVGYAYFPLFLQKDGEMPPFEENTDLYIYNQGAY